MEKSIDIDAPGEDIIINQIASVMPSDSSEPLENSRTYHKSPISCKNAVEFLLDGTLSTKVCRFCLNVTSTLKDVDQIMKISGKRAIYDVSIRDMVEHFYPFRLYEDPYLPNQICESCLDRTITAYLFTQQCERSGRAIRNCFNEIYDKLEKLDPLEPTKKRGRKKHNPNSDVINLSHSNVLDYAEPIVNLINRGSALLNPITSVETKLECPKCWQILPNLESLLNHKQKHPDTMWFHCHSCGSSFAKQKVWNTHVLKCSGKISQQNTTTFRCNTCGTTNGNYVENMQHMEKHKFKTVLNELIVKRSESMCTVCLVKDKSLIDLDKLVTLHGATPELSGNRMVFDILESTVPNIFPDSYTGSKVCDKCLDRAINAYVFVNQAIHTRRRLNICVSSMLENLKVIENPEKSLFVEISNSLICPIQDVIVNDQADDIFDESKLKIDVLEDEFRIKSSSDTEAELCYTDLKKTAKTLKKKAVKKFVTAETDNIPNEIDNPARKVTKTYQKKRVCNGINSRNNNSEENYAINNICSEFLTFRKKPLPKKIILKQTFACPICNKHFIAEYFLRQHVLKHMIRVISCKLCNEKFESKFRLQEHLRIVHVQNCTDVHSCDICGRIYTDSIDLDRHKNSHYNKQCYCEKVFRTQRHFNSHLQRHLMKFQVHNKRSTKSCSFCEKQYFWRNQLSAHVNRVHLQMRPYSCNMCEKQLYTKSDLFNHKKIHRVPSLEKCEFCEKTLKCRRDLVKHIRQHIDFNLDPAN